MKVGLTFTGKEDRELERAIVEIVREYERAIGKFEPFNSAHEGYAVILEEIDELKDEVWKNRKNYKKMRVEAKQVATMAIRFMVDIQSSEGKTNE